MTYARRWTLRQLAEVYEEASGRAFEAGGRGGKFAREYFAGWIHQSINEQTVRNDWRKIKETEAGR